MDPPAGSSGEGSGDYSLRFDDDIQSLMHPSSAATGVPSAAASAGASFTALLGLPPSRAVELLHEPTFPSNAALVDRAARFSVFAAVAASASGDGSPDSGDPPPVAVTPPPPATPRKRKDGCERSGIGKAKAKKGKQAEDDTGEGENKLPYVHVRARRGQATDSHSLAERARREKINARMKLLQELVPGCNKISGTALVLDEIINHVQFLQRQVEYLSMRLAAVNPRIDFAGLDSFLSSASTECGRVTTGCSGRSGGDMLDSQSTWPQLIGLNNNNSNRQRNQNQNQINENQNQFWHIDLLSAQQHLPPPHALLNVNVSPSSLLAFDHHNSATLQPNQLKMEL